MFSRLIAGAGRDQAAGLCQAPDLEAAADYLMAKSTMMISNTTLEPCCICLNDMTEGEAVCLIAKCTHRLHAPCLRKWVKGKTSLSCPLCRS